MMIDDIHFISFIHYNNYCVEHKANLDKIIIIHVDSTIIVPIVVSANGLIAKSLDNHLKRLSLDGWIKGQIQKAVILDTARIVRRFLSL